jgi:hypothetical protein
MTALLVIEALTIALLGVLVVGLLRSHAEILRTIHLLMDSKDLEGLGRRDTSPSSSASVVGRPARDLTGETPWGEAAYIGIEQSRHDTLLAFLSGGCLTCADFWRSFRDLQRLHLPDHTRLVVVTKGPAEESVSRIRELAPSGVAVVMSSSAWLTYEVPGSPYFVLVDGPLGRVVGEGTASKWDQVQSLITQAVSDADLRPRPNIPGDRRNRDRERREQIDAELSLAGIQPGHPSLFGEQTQTQLEGLRPEIAPSDWRAPGQ